MKRILFTVLALASLGSLGLFASGCGGGSGSSAGVATLASDASARNAPNADVTTTASRQDFQEAALAYTKCLRGEGIDVPDPDFSQGGPGRGPGQRGGFLGGANRNDPKFQKAQQKCRSIIDAVRPQFTPERQQQFRDAQVKFAQCMRKNGVDVPDPDFSGQGQGGQGGQGGRPGLFGASGIDPNDPKVRKAMTGCRSVFTDAGLGGGPGGGAGGGFAPPVGGNGG